ncbi:uncharacterized protein LOC129591368 [Paramacrobiotus metropolitanus]|uniref:uncharacterized protein LOC129591368 n=1 Tax=Paramacrobiotus metropolitanus TaxID=2943436 RepID=UPI002445D181|nr:uncharacterized protein LOC129591368 [Paramacrobiotus metropolitanus]
MEICAIDPGPEMQFETLRDLETYMEAYMARTNQLFIKGKRTDILRPSDRFYITHRYSGCRWALHRRRHLRLLGNNTTNRIERFFAMVKAVMRGQGRRVIKRMHLAECIEMVLAAVNSKVTLSDYGEYMNNAKRLIMHDFPDVKVGEMVGRLLTNFAALVVKEQYKLLAREFYTTVSTGADTYETKHKKTGKVYQIICNPDSGEMCCNCYVSCMFGLPCRHVLAARRFQSMHTFDIKDCLPRWQRLSSESSGEQVDLYHDVVLDALSGHMDENEENPEVENKTGTNRQETVSSGSQV